MTTKTKTPAASPRSICDFSDVAIGMSCTACMSARVDKANRQMYIKKLRKLAVSKQCMRRFCKLESRTAKTALSRYGSSSDPFEMDFQYERMMSCIVDMLAIEAQQVQQLRMKISASVVVIEAAATSLNTDESKRVHLQHLVSKLSDTKSLSTLSASSLLKLERFLAEIMSKACLEQCTSRSVLEAHEDGAQAA